MNNVKLSNISHWAAAVFTAVNEIDSPGDLTSCNVPRELEIYPCRTLIFGATARLASLLYGAGTRGTRVEYAHGPCLGVT